MRTVVLCMTLALCGCSNVKRIGEAAGNINNHAARIESNAQDIVEQATAPEPDLAAIAATASQIKSDASSIRAEVNVVTANIGGVKDEGSQLLDTLKWLAIAGVLVAVIVIAWRFGLDRLVYGLIAMTGIPTAAKRQAELDASTLDDASNETIRESIAAKRARDPLYDEEFKRARKRLGKAKS
jgi:hypothetical protein